MFVVLLGASDSAAHSVTLRQRRQRGTAAAAWGLTRRCNTRYVHRSTHRRQGRSRRSGQDSTGARSQPDTHDQRPSGFTYLSYLLNWLELLQFISKAK